MSDQEKKKEVIHSKIWQEVPEPDNPFAAAACYCSGFDVYGDLLGKISWIEYLYLLFKLEPPTKDQARLLEGLAVALANPGPRDLSVRAAMNGGVGGGSSASSLIAALSAGAGQYGGAREVRLFIQLWEKCGFNLDFWEENLAAFSKPELIEVWPDIDHTPGFYPYGKTCATPVIQSLEYLRTIECAQKIEWLAENRLKLEKYASAPLSMVAITASALCDLEFSEEQGEMICLILRLPGAAVHSLEQKRYGWKKYPFFIDGLKLENDPGNAE